MMANFLPSPSVEAIGKGPHRVALATPTVMEVHETGSWLHHQDWLPVAYIQDFPGNNHPSWATVVASSILFSTLFLELVLKMEPWIPLCLCGAYHNVAIAPWTCPRSRVMRVLFLLDLYPIDSTMKQLESSPTHRPPLTAGREKWRRARGPEVSRPWDAGLLFPENSKRDSRRVWRLVSKQDQQGYRETKEPYKNPKPVFLQQA